MHHSLRSIVFLVVLSAAAVLLAGCGKERKYTADGITHTKLKHVDGVIDSARQPKGELTVQLKDGSTKTFSVGQYVNESRVKTLAKSKTSARIYFPETDKQEKPLAVSVAETPFQSNDGLQRYKGRIKRVDNNEVRATGPKGDRSFVIRKEDKNAVDLEQLNQRRQLGSQVYVYYRSIDGVDYIIAHEDAQTIVRG